MGLKVIFCGIFVEFSLWCWGKVCVAVGLGQQLGWT